ncbi:MAG: hemolysin III family protein, partial [Flavobacteriaceae bacterium]|nr:hemolysin III family protein [Flavobacteriaceae bacterium]
MARLQSHFEEKINASSHALGAILGLIGLILLIDKSINGTFQELISVVVYGISIIILFTASALYHAINDESKKHIFRIIDHISIYILIAGTYTPVLLITLPESYGWPLLWIVWGIAIFGLILKTFYTGRFEIFSTLLYLIMGWLIVVDLKALIELMDVGGLILMAAGGFFYTVGIIFYSIERIPYNHNIWHLFVLAGAV